MGKNKVLKFITGNNFKFKEVEAVLKPFPLKQLDLNIEEVQELDVKKIIEHKVYQSIGKVQTPFIVEDTSFYFECFDYVFPGPFIKFFEKHYGPKGLYELTNKMGSYE
jgi:inosine/xanthosine triphosphate pyrophosphatase family protein